MKSKVGKEQIKSLMQFICDTRNLCIGAVNFVHACSVIEDRMSAVHLSDPDAYRDYLEVHPMEYKNLLDRFFVEDAYFFTEPTWSNLQPLLASRLKTHANNGMRCWVIGCGNGREAIGLSIGLSGLFGKDIAVERIKIFGTDIDEAVLNLARHALVDRATLTDQVAEPILSKYFPGAERLCSFAPELRKSIIFGRHDVVVDPPIRRMDIILCRRVLPYLNQDQQEAAARKMLFALGDQGLLVLGEDERLPLSMEARSLAGMSHVYERDCLKKRRSMRGATSADGDGASGNRKKDLTNSLIQSTFHGGSIATLCIDNEGFVAAANARARTTFGLLAQDIGKPLQDLEVSYRPIDLRSLVDVALNELREVVVTQVSRQTGQGRAQVFDVHLTPLIHDREAVGVNVQFQEVTEMFDLQQNLTTVNQSLQQANEELQSAHEELETTNEELHSTNEELETTNEELHATNEELETMNEELQATNSELEYSNESQTELASGLERVNLYLSSILSSLGSAVVVTDPGDRVLMWNDKSADLLGFDKDDARDKVFLDMDLGLPVNEIRSAFEKLALDQSLYEELQGQGLNRRGQKYNCRIRIMPLLKNSGNIVLIDEEQGNGHVNEEHAKGRVNEEQGNGHV